MPKTNPGRRRELADAAIELLAASGVHGLTHRAVERAAAVPSGTASNYFRSREALLVAAAERIVELHLADMDQAATPPATETATRADVADRPPAPSATATTGTAGATGTAAPAGSVVERLAGALAASLFEAATTRRTRYLAVFELQLEAARRPPLAAALARLEDGSILHTMAHHAETGLAIPPAAVPTLVALYGGALFTLVSAPHVGRDHVLHIARAIARGALAGT